MLQIVTDSSCDLPDELIKKYDIRVVSLIVNIGDEYFREGVDISAEDFYKKMAQSPKLPKTSQPPPPDFAEVFRELSCLGPVICITISSKLSGTYQSACLGRDMAGGDVTVFDSLAGSLGHGLQVLKACELARAGRTAGDVVAELEKYRKEMKILILLNTLDNIVKGGRLSRLQGNIAKILDIRILLHNRNGEVVLLEKVRGRKKFFDRALQMICSLCPNMTGRNVGITHFNNPTGVDTIIKALRDKCHARNFIVNSMGATMATYAGEGGVIVSF
jgi:DegV family protein with EDD domain